MIKTDIMLSDTITGKVSPYVAKSYAELLTVMQTEGVERCTVEPLLAGLPIMSATVTVSDVERLIELERTDPA